jgi:hypothetical protein
MLLRTEGIAHSAQQLATGLVGKRSSIRVPVGQDFSHLCLVQNESGTHSDFYLIDNGGRHIRRGKMTGAKG